MSYRMNRRAYNSDYLGSQRLLESSLKFPSRQILILGNVCRILSCEIEQY